jgi:phosphoglycerate dehydrogenase-like enzyme
VRPGAAAGEQRGGCGQRGDSADARHASSVPGGDRPAHRRGRRRARGAESGRAIADLDAEVLLWDGTGDPPPGVERVEFLVARYMARGPLAPEVLARLSRLKVIQLVSAGFENWKPVVPDGVVLCNGRGVHGASTAELAVGGLIALLRQLPRFLDQQRAGTWEPHQVDGLDGRRVLVLGVGDIGARVASAVRAFGAECTVVGHSAREGVLTLADVPALLPEQQAVVVALPLTDRTRHLLDAEFLARLPDGAAVVNVARGPIVDTDALLAELAARRLHAFLDVTDPEPLPDGHPLWSAPNLLITPHVGGGTFGWTTRANRLVHDQVARYLAGQPLLNVV